MIDIFWSPSSQGANLYAYGGTNERDVCNSIADRCDYHAKRHGYTTARNDRRKQYSDHRRQSNGLGPRYHIAIHTNAANGRARGISVYCYRPTDSKRKSTVLSQNLLDELTAINGATNRGLKQGTFDEIVSVNADVAYPEIDYHDNPEGARWILEHIEEIAIGIVKGILKTDGKEWIGEEMLLRVGSRGDAVKILQTQLNQLGYDAGTADGIFGSKTDAAVRAFQRASNITVDGIVGDNTRLAIEKALAPKDDTAEIKAEIKRLTELNSAKDAQIQTMQAQMAGLNATLSAQRQELVDVAEAVKTLNKFAGKY